MSPSPPKPRPSFHGLPRTLASAIDEISRLNQMLAKKAAAIAGDANSQALRDQIASLESENAQLKSENEKLKVRIAELEAEAKSDSDDDSLQASPDLVEQNLIDVIRHSADWKQRNQAQRIMLELQTRNAVAAMAKAKRRR